MPRKRSALLLYPLLTGVLTWACFPKLNQGYLAWVALAPLIFFLLKTRRIRVAFFGGLLAGTVEFLLLLYWIPPVLSHYGGLPVPVAWVFLLVMAATLGCFSAAACALTRFGMNRWGDWILFGFPAAWVALEYARSLFPFAGFPWLLLGYSQTDYPVLVQTADLFGVYGVSFLVAWVNTALLWAWLRRRNGSQVISSLSSCAVLLSACAAYGTAALTRWDRVQPQYQAALLQQNLSADESEAVLAWKYKEGYVKMAERLDGLQTDLLVLPESPSPLIFQYDKAYQNCLRQLARRFPFGIVFNNIRFEEAHDTSAYFNSAFFLDEAGAEVARYDKIHLVPFGEYIPFKKVFFFSETISKDVGDFMPGKNYVIAPMKDHEVNALICFEAVFGDLSRQFIRRGSQLIINLTNDGWYGDTSAPYQHLEMARWRAVETRKWFLRSANTGISAIITPAGRLEASTGLLREAAATGGFSFLAGETFYVRHGDDLPIFCAILWTCILMASFVMTVRGRR
jgi:apolipoprotein N-acyltransferase